MVGSRDETPQEREGKMPLTQTRPGSACRAGEARAGRGPSESSGTRQPDRARGRGDRGGRGGRAGGRGQGRLSGVTEVS